MTELLQSGENELTFRLADGWYRGSCGAWGLKNQYGTETRLLAQLELTMTDGTLQTIATDGSWDWSNDGPIRFADNQDGEIVDAACVPSYDRKAKEISHPVIPTASNNVPVTEHERLKPTCITTPSGKTVLDFGQNIAGYVDFTVRGKRGQRMDETFGLIETVEKAAQIYMLTAHLPRLNTIRDDQMKELADYFGVHYRKDFLSL